MVKTYLQVTNNIINNTLRSIEKESIDQWYEECCKHPVYGKKFQTLISAPFYVVYGDDDK